MMTGVINHAEGTDHLHVRNAGIALEVDDRESPDQKVEKDQDQKRGPSHAAIVPRVARDT